MFCSTCVVKGKVHSVVISSTSVLTDNRVKFHRLLLQLIHYYTFIVMLHFNSHPVSLSLNVYTFD